MEEQLGTQAAVVSPVNVQEFAKKVKEKYPEYKDVDDLTLAQKIVEKYPEYKDRVQFDQPEESGQTKTYMENYLDERFPSPAKPEQKSTNPFAGRSITPEELSFGKTQLSGPKSKTIVSDPLTINPIDVFTNDMITSGVVSAKQNNTEKYFQPAVQETNISSLPEELIASENQSEWIKNNPKLNAVLNMPGMGLIKEAYIGSKKAIGGIGTTLDVIASNISNSISGGAQIDEQGNITYPWEIGYKQDKSEFYKIVRKFEEETPISSGGATAFFGQLLPQTSALAATVLLRSPSATKAYLASMYGSSFGNGVETYDDYIKETGKQENPTDRYLVGMGYGAAEYIGEKVGLDYFMPKGYGKLVAKSLDASPSMAKEIGKSVLENYAKLTKQPLSAILKKIAIGSQVEGGQEVATELMDIAIDTWLTGKDVTGQEIRDRLLQSYGGGALMGAGIAPFAHISQNAATTERRREQGKVTISIDEEGLPVEIVQSGDKVFGIRPDGEEVKNISKSTIDKAQTLKTEDFEKAINQYNKTGSITTATIEGQQYTINNPEDIGQEGKPIFAKDAEGNVTAVQNHKVENPVTQTLGEIDQANQQAAEQAKLYEGIADPNAQIINEVEDNGARFIDFSNGQTKIIFNGQEVIANDVNEKYRILESIVKDNQLPEPKLNEQGEVISPVPEKKVITQKFGNTPIDIIENEGYDEIVPSEKMPLEKALPALEKKFKDNKKFKVVAEKVQVEEPGETKYDDPVKKTVIKSIRIVPKVSENVNVENQNVENVPETQQQLADQQNVENIQSVVSSQNNQLQNEESEKSSQNVNTNINLDNIDTDNFIYVTHQTDQRGLETILKNGFDIRGGLNGTTLFGNRESIQQQIQAINEGKGHRGSDRMLVFAFPKNEFQNVRQLDQISDQLIDNGQLTIPSQYIFDVHEKSSMQTPETMPESGINQGENTPQAQQGQGEQEGLEENVNTGDINVGSREGLPNTPQEEKQGEIKLGDQISFTYLDGSDHTGEVIGEAQDGKLRIKAEDGFIYRMPKDKVGDVRFRVEEREKSEVEQTIDYLQSLDSSPKEIVVGSKAEIVQYLKENHYPYKTVKLIELHNFYATCIDGLIIINTDLSSSNIEAIKSWAHERTHSEVYFNVSDQELIDLYNLIGEQEFRRIVPAFHWNDPIAVKADEYLAYAIQGIAENGFIDPQIPAEVQKIITNIVNEFTTPKILQDAKNRTYLSDEKGQVRNENDGSGNGRGIQQNSGNNGRTESDRNQSLRVDEAGTKQEVNELAGSNTRNGRGIRQRTSSDANGSEGSAVMASGIQNEADRRGTSDIRSGRILDGNSTGLTISDQASEDLKNRHNALDAITRIGTELNIPVQVVNSSELTSDNNQLVFVDNGTVTIVSDRVKSVSEVIKALVKEVATTEGLREMLAGADPNSIIGKQLAKFDELSPEELQSDKLAQIIRKAFRLTSNQFSQNDLLDIIREQRRRMKERTGQNKFDDAVRFRTEDQSQIIQDARKFLDFEDFVDAYQNADFRDSHSAPGNSQSGLTVQERMDQGDDFNLAEVVQGFSTQPDDYFDPRNGARWYGYDDKEGMQSYFAIRSVMNDINSQIREKGEITKMPKIKAYRAVPKEVLENKFIDRDWITFSKEYAKGHGESRFGKGEYKIISQSVPADQVWWDGNDINEWGYDTGSTDKLYRNDLKKIWDEVHGETRFRIIGEAGAANLDKAEEATTRLDNLKVAREMDKPINEATEEEFDDAALNLATLDLEDDQVRYPKTDGRNSTFIDGGTGYNLYILDKEEIPEAGPFEISIENDEGDQIGFIRATTSNKVISINLIHIKEAFRGNGIGTDIYEKLLNNGYTLKSDSEITDSTYSLYSRLAKYGYKRLVYPDGRIGLKKQFTPQQIRLATGWEKGVDGKWRYEVPDGKFNKVVQKMIDNQKANNIPETWGLSYPLSLNKIIDDPQMFIEYPELANVKVQVNVKSGNKNKGSYSSNLLDTELGKIDVQASDFENFKSVLIHEIQHAIQEIEGFAKGGNIESMTEFVINDLEKIIKDSDTMKELEDLKEKVVKSKNKKTGSIVKEIEKEQKRLLNNLINKLVDDGTISSMKADNYHRLAGEVESRNVQTRMNMTPEERLNTLLSETEDVAREDQIVLMDGLGVSNLENQIPETITVNGVERPTRNSKGQFIYTTKEGIENFWKWFGDSKVVDEQDKPLVVYHGTASDFDEFSVKGTNFNQSTLGYYFTSGAIPNTSKGIYYGSTASEYAQNAQKSGYAELDGANIIPVYLKIENPIKVEADGWYSANTAVDKQRSEIENIKSKGKNDGVISEYSDKNEGGNEKILVAFSPTQIKSATGNIGTFSPETNDIRFRIQNKDKIIDVVNLKTYNTQSKLDTDKLLKNGYEYIDKAMPNITKDDYFISTKGNFERVSRDEWSKLDSPITRSDSGSSYKLDGEYIYRASDHWGRVASCDWNVNSNYYYRSPNYYYKNNDGKEIYLGKNEPLTIGKIKLSDLKRIPSSLVRIETPDIRFRIDKASEEVNTNPTEAQKSAGNYRMGHIRFDGFDISIENPKGSVRSGVDKQGNEWSQVLPADYGYFRGTVGKDKDHVDVFIGSKPEASNIYIIDQIDPNTGKFDEHKVMLGFDSQAKAKQTYLAAFEPGWKGLGQITKTDKQGLKEWFESGDQKKPFSDNHPQIRFRFAFHGSPHSFDKFSLSKIGTGEGAQAYGWGLYFTDKESIAKSYANVIKTTVKLDGIKTNSIAISELVKQYIQTHNSNNPTLEQLKNMTSALFLMEGISKEEHDLVQNSNSLFIENIPTRNLYKVKIHGDKTLEELNFLRWDKPVTDESRNKIANQIDVEREKFTAQNGRVSVADDAKEYLYMVDDAGKYPTGKDIYSQLESYLGSDKKASLFLLRAGIDGIIYPAEYQTKGTHEEAFNYVVFDENAVQIQEHTRFRIAPRDERIDQLREDLDKVTSLAKSAERLKELEESKIGKKVAERQAIIKQISGYKQGYKAGANEKRFTLYVIQRYITKYANENINYDEATKGEIQQLLTAMQNANTPAKIAKAFERIDELASKGIKRKLINKIAKLLKNIAPKLQSGKPVGNISPEAYQALNKIQKIIEMSPEEYDQYLEEISDGDIESMALASMFGNLKEKSIDNLFEALKTATSIKKDGKLWYKEKIDELKKKHEKLINKAVDDITGGKGIQSSQQIRTDKGVVDKNSSLKEYLSKNLSFEWLLDLISNNKKDRTGYGFMQDHFGDLANKSENEESKGIRDTLELINEKAFEIFGKEKSALAKIFSKNSKVVKKSGVTYATNDGRKEIPLSQNEAYKRWMEMNDPTLTPTFEKMGWDAQSLEELEKFIDPKVMKWAQWQINEFFPKYYERVNNIYKEMYFADLPFNPNYSGYLKREKTSVGDKEDSMLRPSTLIQSVANSSLKSRIKNTRDIMLQDGDSALARHIAEMEHFIAWAESIREIRAVLSSDAVQDAIKKEHGNNIRTVLNERINSLVRGGVDRGEVNYLVDWIRKNYVTSALGINVSLTPKQMTAMFSYLNDISIMDYIKGASEFIANPTKAIEALNDSEFIRRRYEKGWTHEIVAAMKRDNPNTLAGTKSKVNAVRDALMLPIMLGDKFAVYSGYPVYSKFFKEYKANNPLSTDKEAHDFAINKFERVAKRTQQSSDVTDTSRFQETSLGKVFMMFKNQQQQYFRYEMAAINSLIKGKGSKAENAKIILLTHIILPVIFQMVANWFTDEDDDKERMRLLRAALLGPLDGLMIAGDIIGYGLERIMGEKWSYSASPMFDTVQDLGGSIDNMIKYLNEPYPEKEAEDLQKALDFAIQFTSSTTTGIPYEPAKRVYNKITGSEKDKRTEEQASEIIRNADEFRKFVKEAAKRNDREAYDLFTKDKNITSSVSIISKYDSRIQKLKKGIKHYDFIKDQKKVDELEKLLDQTYKELIEGYKDLDYPKYKLNK